MGIIDLLGYKNLTSSDGNLPRAYGLPKIHKENNPLRIIISSVGSPTYKFARFLHDIIVKNVKVSHSFVKHSLDLKNKLCDIALPPNYKIISLDVSSLFTNVPRELVMEALEKRWGDIGNFCKSDGLNVDIDEVKNEFLSAINFVMSSTTFKFNDRIYNQKYGTAMGSPISPIISDLVMQDLENDCLAKLGFETPFYFRYVDDIITAVPDDKISTVLDTFNSYHERLQFTYEVELDNKISFLDLMLIRQDSRLSFNWYRKPTFSGRFINFLSCHPFHQKVSIIYYLVDKAVGLSDSVFHSGNLKIIEHFLKQNNFPEGVVNKYIKKRIRSIWNNVNHNSSLPNMQSEDRKYMVLPYFPELQDPTKNFLKKYNLGAAFKADNKINGKFIKKEKDKLNKRKNAIWQLKKRVLEHKNNIKRDVQYHNVVSKHRINYDHEFDFDNAKILDVERDWRKRNISEMLHIKINHDTINLQQDTKDLNKIYDKLLNHFSDNIE